LVSGPRLDRRGPVAVDRGARPRPEAAGPCPRAGRPRVAGRSAGPDARGPAPDRDPVAAAGRPPRRRAVRAEPFDAIELELAALWADVTL